MITLGTTPPRLRAGLLWSATTGALVAVVAWSARDLPGPGRSTGAGFDQLLVQGCAVVLVGCALWWWLVTTLVALEVLVGHRGPRVLAPTRLRRLLLGLCGVAVLGATVVPAHATPGALHHGRAASASPSPAEEPRLDGLPLPERPVGGLRAADRRGAVRAWHVVRRGESLWSIAADLLPGADDAALDRAWRALHALNRPAIGPDPDLIRTGQRLLVDLPHPSTHPHRGES